jgi:hypothetical protein
MIWDLIDGYVWAALALCILVNFLSSAGDIEKKSRKFFYDQKP